MPPVPGTMREIHARLRELGRQYRTVPADRRPPEVIRELQALQDALGMERTNPPATAPRRQAARPRNPVPVDFHIEIVEDTAVPQGQAFVAPLQERPVPPVRPAPTRRAGRSAPRASEFPTAAEKKRNYNVD